MNVLHQLRDSLVVACRDLEKSRLRGAKQVERMEKMKERMEAAKAKAEEKKPEPVEEPEVDMDMGDLFG